MVLTRSANEFSISDSNDHHPHPGSSELKGDNSTMERADDNARINLCSNCEKALAVASDMAGEMRIQKQINEDDYDKISKDKPRITEENFEGVELNPPPKGN